ncbi:MAG: glycosyltransferase family 39 protein [Thermoanaerobaculia bacterium]
MLGVAAALLLVEALGWSALALAAPRPTGPLALRLAGAFVAGLATLSAFLHLASLAGASVTPILAALAVGPLVLAAMGLARRRRGRLGGRTEPATERPWSASEVALAVLALALLAVPAALAAVEPVVEWDAVAIWGLKARELARHSLAHSTLLHDPARAYAHLDYPLLWPFVLAWVWSLAGVDRLTAVPLAGWAIAAATVGLLYGALRALLERRSALAAAAAVAALPILGAKSIRLLADPVAGLFLLAWVAGSALYLARRDRGALALAGFALAGLLTTKNEGLGLAAIGVAVFAVGLGLRRPLAWRELGAGLAPALLAVPALAVARSLPHLHHNTGAEISPASLLAHGDRWREVLARLPGELLARDDWGFFWPLAALGALLALARRPGGDAARPAALMVLLPWPLIVAGFVGHELPPALLMDVAASRLALQLAPAAAFVAALGFRARPSATDPPPP